MGCRKIALALLFVVALSMAVFLASDSDDSDAAFIGDYHSSIFDFNDFEESSPSSTDCGPSSIPVTVHAVPLVVPEVVVMPENEPDEAPIPFAMMFMQPVVPEFFPILVDEQDDDDVSDIDVPEGVPSEVVEAVSMPAQVPTVQVRYNYNALMNLTLVRSEICQYVSGKDDGEDADDDNCDTVVVEEIESDPAETVPQMYPDYNMSGFQQQPIFCQLVPNTAGAAVGPIFC